MKLKIFLLLGLYLLLCNICDLTESKAVIGPNVRQTVEYEFPFVAFITIAPNRPVNPTLPVYCMGTVISYRHVMTTEHCLNNRVPEDIMLNIGSFDLRQTQEYYPEWWVNYETWLTSKNKRLPVAKTRLTIMKLNQTITDIVPATLSFVNKRTLYGNIVTIATWGIANNRQVPTIMEAADVTVITKEDCEQRYRSISTMSTNVHDGIFCTFADPYVVVNNGDHGSPIIFENKVVGITKGAAPNFGENPYRNQINIHYSLAFFQTFIEDILHNCP